MMDRRSRRRARTIDRGSDGGTNAAETRQRGIPIDAFGGGTVDPTRNVLDLVEAAIRRVDDLRDAETRRVDEVMRVNGLHTEQVADLREQHIQQLASERASHTSELMLAEAKRIDAIRLIDTQAVATANEKANNQAAVLANQVAESAQALRTLVDTNAQAVAAAQTQIIAPITDRIALLERALYEGQGKQTIADPQLAQLLGEVKNLTASNQQVAGRSEAVTSTWSNAGTLIPILISLASLVVVLIKLR